MKLKYVLTAFFIVYIIGLSFIPIIHDATLAEARWVGYGTGAYQYQNQRYYVLFNDPYDGSSKPHIHLSPDFAPAARVPLLEFSDWTSYVNEHNLFNEFNATVQATEQMLNVTYVGPINVTYVGPIVVHKLVEMSPSFVNVTLYSEKEFKGHIEIWRWVMTSVNGIYINETVKPDKLIIKSEEEEEPPPKGVEIKPTIKIGFTFEDERLQSVGMGNITLNALPREVWIWPHQKGFNKISIDFKEKSISAIITGMINRTETVTQTATATGTATGSATSSQGWSYVLLRSVLPLVAVSVIVLYLLVDRFGGTLKDRIVGRRR